MQEGKISKEKNLLEEVKRKEPNSKGYQNSSYVGPKGKLIRAGFYFL
jgi:hypothetical protein